MEQKRPADIFQELLDYLWNGLGLEEKGWKRLKKGDFKKKMKNGLTYQIWFDRSRYNYIDYEIGHGNVEVGFTCKDQESILMQKNACHDFAEKKGWNIVGEEQEIGVSGYKVSADDLVKLQRIRKAAEQGEFDIFLVFMYDRLGRNLNETPFIAKWFTKKGIHVWSVYEGEIIDGVDAERMLDYIRSWQTDEAQKL